MSPAAEPAVPGPQTPRARLAGAGVAGGLVAALALLAAGQHDLSVADWMGWPRPESSWIPSPASPPEGWALTRLPEGAFAPFAAFILGALVFAVLVLARGALARLGEPAVAPISVPGWRSLLRFPGSLWLCLFLIAETVVVLQAAFGRGVSPTAWLLGIAALLLSGRTVDRSTDPPEPPPAGGLLRNAGFVLGTAALLSTLAAFRGGSRAVLAVSAVATVLLLGGALVPGWRSRGLPSRIERLLLPAMCAGSFLALSHGLDSWAWSFLGDEYAFHQAALDVIDGRIPASRLLSGEGAYGYHPVLSSLVQGTTMLLYGRTAYGWKVSHSLLLALAILPLYAVARRLLGRTGGLVTAGLYGVSHVLISFGRLGSNNAQAAFLLPLAFAALLWAMGRGRLVPWILTGVVVGLGFYTFGIARIYSLAVALWLALYLFPTRKSVRTPLVAWTAVVGTALLVALPVLSTRSAWQGQLHSTILNSEVATSTGGKLAQLARNSLLGSVGFLSNPKPAVFTYGPHADPVTGGLALLGIAALVASLHRGLRLRVGILGSAALLVLLVAGIQQYDVPNITRTFALVPVWALLAGVGFTALVEVAGIAGAGAAGLGVVLLAVAAPVNVWMAEVLSVRKMEQPELAVMLQVAQSTAARDGSGPFVNAVVTPDQREWIVRLYTIHGVPANRFRVLSPAEALGDAELCSPRGPAALAMPAIGIPGRDAILARIQACWAGATLTALKDGTGNARVLRALSASARASLHSVPGALVEQAVVFPVWSDSPAGREPWFVEDARGLSAGPGGSLATVEGRSGAILILRPDGRPSRLLSGGMVSPSSVAFTPDGGLLVLDSAVGDCLIGIGPDGLVRNRAGYGLGMFSPQGVAVAADGSVLVADTGSSRVAVLDAQMKVVRELRASGALRQPMAVASGPGGAIAVSDPAAAKVFVLSAEDDLLAEAALMQDGGPPSGVCAVGDGTFLASDTGSGRVFRIRVGGPVEVVAEGLAQPGALAVASDGAAFVVERGKNRITRIPLAPPGR